ncbi:hypothetical protein GGI07_002989 [Coemansia sp. Benny D115]|nr:hypothetical protein GGI07_002989 [Coemansia sp. Benny D115]
MATQSQNTTPETKALLSSSRLNVTYASTSENSTPEAASAHPVLIAGSGSGSGTFPVADPDSGIAAGHSGTHCNIHRRGACDTAITTAELSWSDVPCIIENSGSTARDFYAAERNYLSWLRLSLTIMSTGAVALSDFSQLRGHLPDNANLSRLYIWLIRTVEKHSDAIGLALFFLAAFTGLVALAIFYHTHAQLALLRQPLRWTGMLMTSVTFAIALASLAIALASFWR